MDIEKMLKGNYQVSLPDKDSSRKGEQQTQSSEDLMEQFESSALEKLGGSIAFVKKSANFIWKGNK